MSKFRARQLDASKPIPVYMQEDIPDFAEFNAINRTVPQMPTGMEKEEETVSSRGRAARVVVRRRRRHGAPRAPNSKQTNSEHIFTVSI